ncbi:ABC transporter ATP-binding protein [Microvirga aerophila]|uniref:Dipeptide/oligopeptide/nickel ABC transporter ATP-binding protein n=1 Tax=Microvirga aerophila TaxID=670291 RepID=A0A512BX28_9HYPH|nr:ABC transporter ATP-binding protein [Microvirga aerophila]GEO16505.1 dipeptide/oligopeptide/nickel ABC transporter ATP-binding protein [Microvirga aerophila]
MTALLSIENYHLDIPTFDGTLKVLDGINLSLAQGETLGIVGESGCGKTVLARSILGIGPQRARRTSGRMTFDSMPLDELNEAEWRRIRGVKISMIFQDPMTYLNPLLTVGRQLSDVLVAHARALSRPALSRQERRRRCSELLDQVQIRDPERVEASYPHQLSGGMRQRILIAMALAGEPKLLIADEPTTALDVTIQAQILDLLRDLVHRLGLTVVMISHDVGAIAAIAQRVAVMYAGVVVEQGATNDILTHPRHPYTQGLLGALPDIEGDHQSLEAIPGTIPNLIHPPSGCRFHPRCPRATAICTSDKPAMTSIGADHVVACHHALD